MAPKKYTFLAGHAFIFITWNPPEGVPGGYLCVLYEGHIDTQLWD